MSADIVDELHEFMRESRNSTLYSGRHIALMAKAVVEIEQLRGLRTEDANKAAFELSEVIAQRERMREQLSKTAKALNDTAVKLAAAEDRAEMFRAQTVWADEYDEPDENWAEVFPANPPNESDSS